MSNSPEPFSLIDEDEVVNRDLKNAAAWIRGNSDGQLPPFEVEAIVQVNMNPPQYTSQVAFDNDTSTRWHKLY